MHIMLRSCDNNPIYLIYAAGTDYSTPTTQYVLTSGDTRECVDVIIRGDVIFEREENFRGQLQGFVLDGRNVASIEGVTLRPDRTVVQIEDNDGERQHRV